MRLIDGSGISCDICGVNHCKEFEYYSVDIYSAKAHDGHTVPIDIVRRSKVVFSFDVCAACYKTLTDRAVRHYKAVVAGVVCDLSGTHLIGEFEYHYVDITRVNVKIPSTGKAVIELAPRELELTISDIACAELINTVLQRRKAGAGWLTSST